MADVNYFSTRDQIIFLSYQDIIKQNYAYMIYLIIEHYYDDLIDILRLDELKDYDIPNLQRLCIERIYKNPLKYIARSQEYFKVCDELLELFEKEMYHIYTDAPLTDFGKKMYTILLQKNVKKVYIHTDKLNHQIAYDTQNLFGEFMDKIELLYGDFGECIAMMETRPTCYIVNDVEYIKTLIDNNWIEYTDIILAELGYNFELDKDSKLVVKYGIENLMEEKIFKFATLSPINLEEKHFTSLNKEEIL